MNTFLQLREQDAEVKNGNGDFITKLKKPFSLLEGDQVVLNKAIIDSRSVDSGKVLLEKDTNLKATFSYYIRNYDISGKTDVNDVAWTTSDLDSELYVLSEEITPGTALIEEVNRVQINQLREVFPPILEFDIVYSYYPVGSAVRVPVVFALKIDGTKTPIIFIKDNIGLNAVKKVGEPLLILDTRVSDIKKFGLDPTSLEVLTSPVPTAGTHYEPYTEEVEITLDAGSYNPEDLAERISQLFTQLTPDKTYLRQPTGNPLLLNTESPEYVSLNEPLFIRFDGDVNPTSGGSPYIYKGAFKYITGATGDHFFFGTSQMNLRYDEATNRFMWDYLHFPYYNSTGEMAVAMKAINGSADTFKLVNQISGILLNSLTATIRSTGEPFDFWSGTLGFNLSDLCVFPQHKNSATLNARVPFYSRFELGEQITGGETGIDVIVDKTNIPQVPSLLNIEPTITQTFPIRASGNFGVINLSSGYFFIEIQGLNNELITNTDIKSHIFGIVSRYYENENYTSGTQEDAIIYQHVGSPLYLNELKIRILDSNYNVANIGVDNTIFLQVLKQPRQPQLENKKEK
tara:strand:- start:661 stop:2379 length:1719 start_codon:yes stop_codon:yes gene_type:complete